MQIKLLKLKGLYNKFIYRMTNKDLEALLDAREHLSFNKELDDNLELKMEEMVGRGLLGSGVGDVIIRTHLNDIIKNRCIDLCHELSNVKARNKNLERILCNIIDRYFSVLVATYDRRIKYLKNDEKKQRMESMKDVDSEHCKMHYIHRFRAERIKNRLSSWSEWRIRFAFLMLGILLTKLATWISCN